MTFDAVDQRQRYSDDEIDIFLFLGRELMKVHKMERLDDALHDFKNPAIAVAGFAKRVHRLLREEGYSAKKEKVDQGIEIIQKEKVNVISGAPAMYHLLLTLPNVDEYDTRSITKCTEGAVILPDETKEKLLRLFPNAEGVYDVYGCTEASARYCNPQGKGLSSKT